RSRPACSLPRGQVTAALDRRWDGWGVSASHHSPLELVMARPGERPKGRKEGPDQCGGRVGVAPGHRPSVFPLRRIQRGTQQSVVRMIHVELLLPRVADAEVEWG